MEDTNGQRRDGAGDLERDADGGPVAVMFRPGLLTKEQYDETVRELDRRGLSDPDGRLLHMSFEVDGTLHLLDIWESEEAFLGEFGQTLVDWWGKQRRDPGRPDVHALHNLIVGTDAAPFRGRYS
jgi:hypothetical protein